MSQIQQLNSMIKAEEKQLIVNIDYVIVSDNVNSDQIIVEILRLVAQLVYIALMMVTSTQLMFQSNNVQRRLEVGKPHLNRLTS